MNTKATILIAEDEDINFQYLQALVSDFAEKVLRARNGSEAIAICQNNKSIDLVLMDIGMPLIDGLQATREIKKFAPDLPILAQTAFSMPEEFERVKKAGCDAIITKPFRRDSFTKTISKYLKNIG